MLESETGKEYIDDTEDYENIFIVSSFSDDVFRSLSEAEVRIVGAPLVMKYAESDEVGSWPQVLILSNKFNDLIKEYGFPLVYLFSFKHYFILGNTYLHTQQNNNIEDKKTSFNEKVQVGKDQEKAQSEKGAIRKRFPLQKPRWEKTKLTIRYLYHETYCKPNEQLFSQ